MGYNIVIRIRGQTDWIKIGYAVTKPDADDLAKRLIHLVQIVTLPEGKELKDLENKLRDKEKHIFIDGGIEDSKYDIIYEIED